MSARLRLWLLYLVLTALTLGALAAACYLSARGVPTPLAVGAAAGGIVAVTALAFLLLDLSWVRPSHALARELELLIHANAERPLREPSGHALGRLPSAILALVEHWRRLRRGHDQALAEATQRASEHKSRLEAILRDSSDGLICCSADRRILLFNDAARRILSAGPELGLDRPLDALVPRQPVAHAFTLLREREVAGSGGPCRDEFVCGTVDGSRLLRCRMALIKSGTGEVIGFVLDFADMTARLGDRAAQVRLLERTVEMIRAPAAALTAAAEVLADQPELDQPAREQFIDVVTREGTGLGQKIDDLSAIAHALAVAAWPQADLLSSDLARRVRHRLSDGEPEIKLIETSPALWLHGDGYHLGLLLERLIRRLHGATGVTSFDLEIRAGERRVGLDLVWEGARLPVRTLDVWLEEPLGAGHAAASLREVLAEHGAELWSQSHEHAGRALLRLPLPAPKRPQIGEATAELEPLPPRPEFYDFALLEHREPATGLLERSLRSLSYVVFDTETTGLVPHKDQIIQVAGVRIVNRRLLGGETFDRLVNPGRKIPKTSIRFHGITDAMVRGRPPIEIVLPQFHAFARDAVLVAHNAAFDLAFLREVEERCGVHFDQPVLDTLLLSVILHDHTDEHSLDAIAERFGITLFERHQALGDAMGTAQVFLRMLDLLEGHGIHTLGEALSESERAVSVRKRQREQFGPAERSPAPAIEAVRG